MESPWLDLLLLSPVWVMLSLSVSPLAIHGAALCRTVFRLDLSLSLGFGGGGVNGNGLFSRGFSEASSSSWGRLSVLNVMRSPTKVGFVGKSTTISGGCSRPNSKAGTLVLWAVRGGGVGGCWGSRWRPSATKARRAAPLSNARWVFLVWGGTVERQSKFGEPWGDKNPSSLPDSSPGRAVHPGSLTELEPGARRDKSECKESQKIKNIPIWSEQVSVIGYIECTILSWFRSGGSVLLKVIFGVSVLVAVQSQEPSSHRQPKRYERRHQWLNRRIKGYIGQSWSGARNDCRVC